MLSSDQYNNIIICTINVICMIMYIIHNIYVIIYAIYTIYIIISQYT